MSETTETTETPAAAPVEAPAVTTAAPAVVPPDPPKDEEEAEPQDIFSLFESDPNAEDLGVWMTLGVSAFRVRSFNSRTVQDVIEAQRKRQARILNANNGVLPEAVRNKNSAETTSAMVTEWRNVPDPVARGTLMECTKDNKLKLFSVRELRNLQNRIWAFSVDAANYLKTETERLEGNS